MDQSIPTSFRLATITKNDDRMMHATLARLRSLMLDSMAVALEERLAQPGSAAFRVEERVSLLIDRARSISAMTASRWAAKASPYV